MPAIWRLSIALVALAVGLLAISPAAAGRHWCRKDPVFQIAGTSVSVEVSVPDNKKHLVNGPVRVVLHVPSAIPARLTFTDEGFNGHGEIVEIVASTTLKQSASGIRIKAVATVPTARSDFPMLLTITPKSGKAAEVRGRTNTKVRAQALVVPSG